jgi:hypothetical protein
MLRGTASTLLQKENMYASSGTPSRARWAVMWVYRSKRGKPTVARKDFGDDVASATELYLKARDSGKKFATLACVNMGFPPPVELRPHNVVKKGRDKRTRKIRIVTVHLQPMKDLNHEGKLWCPYCRELRPFVLRKTAVYKGIMMRDPRYVCPVCTVSHRDHNVRLWNPTAVMHMDATVAPFTRKKKTTKPVRRRRR